MEEEGRVYARWEEVVVSNDKGRRVVHYYLRDAGGAAELAVVGRERSVRHMSYAVPGRFVESLAVKPPHLPPASPSSPSAMSDAVPLRWKTRREVIDWLSSLVSDSVSYGSSPVLDRFLDDEEAQPAYYSKSKGLSSGKMEHDFRDFSWLGSAWNCRKRRKHYRSFSRNGTTISVHDFVYIMSEEKRRLVAYVEDLYEDLRANRMVVVRWFHKVDEVNIVLPPDVKDREIFFSLCLQDFSVECIDGLAAVLGSQHFEKFKNEARQTMWEPYLCCRQIDNDDIKPFDITQVQGYWSQELLRSFYTSSLKVRLKITRNDTNLEGNVDKREPQIGPKKKHKSDNGDNEIKIMARDMSKSRSSSFGTKMEKHVTSPRLLRKELLKRRFQSQQLCLGSHVEVLSQDSGMRGCWFRCIIIRQHKDKVKVQYQDVQDVDGSSNLEEWIPASRLAAPDNLGIRLHGRAMIRPHISNRETIGFDTGAVVDAWWNDGWWEGVVIHKNSEGKLHVYFPGEQLSSVFDQDDLRHSQDWLVGKWYPIKDRQDIVSSLSSSILEHKHEVSTGDDCNPPEANVPIMQHDASCPTEMEMEMEMERDDDIACKSPAPEREPSNEMEEVGVPNLVEDCLLDGLKWSSSRKRKRVRLLPGDGSGYNRRSDGSFSSTQEDTEESNDFGGFLLPKSLLIDRENCKIGGDRQLPISICSSLVMSR